MNDQTIGMVVFVFAFCSAVYFLKQLLGSAISPALKADVERLRENRRLRRAARRRK